MKVSVFLLHPQVAAWNFSELNAERLLALCPEAELTVCANAEDLKATLPGVEIVIGWTFEPSWFAHAPHLRWLVTPAAGRDFMEVAPPAGIRLMHSSFHGELIAETVLGLMLGHCRALFAATRMQAEPWPNRELGAAMAPLRGSHLVVLGYGAIGRWIARLAKAMGVRVTGVRRNPGAVSDEYADQILPVSSLDPVLPTADHLVLAMPGGAETNLLMDSRRLSLLPAHAAIYNVGRGNAIDESALAEALQSAKLAGAYLDVFAREPLPMDSPLRSCRSALLLPHVSAVAPNYLDLFVDEFAGRIRAEW